MTARTSNDGKKLRGTDQPARLRPESQFRPSEPDPPPWLDNPLDLERFSDLASQLTAAGHLTYLDGGVLGRLVQVEREILETAEEVIRIGRFWTAASGYTQQTAPAAALVKLRADELRLHKVLGMTPSSRRGVDVVKRPSGPSVWDKFVKPPPDSFARFKEDHPEMENRWEEYTKDYLEKFGVEPSVWEQFK